MFGLLCGMFFSYLAAYVLTYMEFYQYKYSKNVIENEDTKENVSTFSVTLSLFEISAFAVITLSLFLVLMFYNTGVAFNTDIQYFVFAFLFLLGGIFPIIYRSYLLFKLYRTESKLFLTNFIIIVVMIITLFCNLCVLLTNTIYKVDIPNETKIEWVDMEYNRIVEELNSDGFNKDIISEAIQYNHNVLLVKELEKYDCDISDETLEQYQNGKEIDINSCISYYVEKNLNMTLKTNNVDITDPIKE